MSDDPKKSDDNENSGGDRQSIVDAIPGPEEGDALFDQLFGGDADSGDAAAASDDAITHAERASVPGQEAVASEGRAWRPAVVVVEEDVSVRTAMVRALTSLVGVESAGAESLDEALVIAAKRVHGLFVIHLDMAAQSGIEVLGPLAAMGLKVPVVFAVKARGGSVADDLSKSGIYVLDKPIQFRDLQRLIEEDLNDATAAKDYSPPGLGEQLQLATLSEKTLTFEVHWDGDREGRVLVVAGEVWDARCEDFDALRALGAVAAAKDATISCRTLAHVPAEEARRLQGPLDEMLLAALERHSQMEDQATAASTVPGASEAPGLADASSEPAEEVVEVEPGAVILLDPKEGETTEDDGQAGDRLSTVDLAEPDEHGLGLAAAVAANEPSSDVDDASVEPVAVDLLENLGEASAPSDATWTMVERGRDGASLDPLTPSPSEVIAEAGASESSSAPRSAAPPSLEQAVATDPMAEGLPPALPDQQQPAGERDSSDPEALLGELVSIQPVQAEQEQADSQLAAEETNDEPSRGEEPGGGEEPGDEAVALPSTAPGDGGTEEPSPAEQQADAAVELGPLESGVAQGEADAAGEEQPADGSASSDSEAGQHVSAEAASDRVVSTDFEPTEQTQPVDLAVVEAEQASANEAFEDVDAVVAEQDAALAGEAVAATGSADQVEESAVELAAVELAAVELAAVELAAVELAADELAADELDADVMVALGDVQHLPDQLVDATVRLMQSGERDAWVSRAEFLRAEAPASDEPAKRASALLVVSELYAMAGEEKLAEEVAREALELAPSSPLAHRQVRGLLANRSAWPEVVEALETEARVAPSPEAKTHSALLAADLARFSLGDREAASAHLDRAERSASDDARVAVSRLAQGLAVDDSVPELGCSGVHAAALKSAVRALGLSRGALQPTEAELESSSPHAALLALRAVIRKGDPAATLAALDRLGSKPEFAQACQWLSASLAAADGSLRAKSLTYLDGLKEGPDALLAERMRVRRAVELGRTDDVVALLNALDSRVLNERDKLVLAALTGQAPGALSDWLQDVASDASLAGLAAAASAALSDSTDPERNVHYVGSANARLGSSLARRLCAWSQQSFSGVDSDGLDASPNEQGLPSYLLDAAIALGDDEPRNGAARAIMLEHYARSGQVAALIKKLSPQVDADRDRDQALLESVLLEQGSSGPELVAALEALQGRVQDSSMVARLIADAGASNEAIEAFRRLAERAEDAGARARALADAGALALRKDSLEQGHKLLADALNAAPQVAPMSIALGMKAARDAGNERELDRWFDRAWRHSSDAVDMVAAAMRMRVDNAERRRLLFEAQQQRSGDYSLREVYEWSAVGTNDRAPWLLRWLESGIPDDSCLAVEAAMQFELSGDLDNAAQCLETIEARLVDAEESDSEHAETALLPIFSRRYAMAGIGMEKAAASMLSAQRQSTEAIVRAEWLGRLAALAQAGGAHAEAEAYLIQASEEVSADVLVAHDLARQALRERGAEAEAGSDGEPPVGILERYAGAMARSLDGQDGLSFSMLLHRLAEQRGDTEAMAAAVVQGLEQQPSSLWALRHMVAMMGSKGDARSLAELHATLAGKAGSSLERSSHWLRAAEAMLEVNDNEQGMERIARSLEAHGGNLQAVRLRAEQAEANSEAVADAWEAYAVQLRAPAERIAVLYRAAKLHLEAGEEAGDQAGCRLLEEVVAIDPNYEDAFERLQELLVATAQYERQAKLLATRLAVVRDEDERARLEIMRGQVLVDLGSADEARQALEAALKVRPDDLIALRAYVDVCEADEDWAEVEKNLVRMGRLISAPEEQAEHYARLARLYGGPLPNLDRAEQAYRQVLKLQADNEEAKEQLVELLLRSDKAADALPLQSELVAGDAEPKEGCARAVRLAEIHECLGEVEQAEKTLRDAQRRFGKDAQLFRANYELLGRQDKTDEAAELLGRVSDSVRRGLAAGRFDATLFDLVSVLAELRGDEDAARVAEATLCAVEGEQKAMVGGGALAANGEFDEQLAPEVFSPALRQLLAKTGQVMDGVVPFDLKALRAKPLGPAQSELHERITRIAETYELSEVQVLVSNTLGKVCVPVSSEPPVLCLGLPLLQVADEAVRDFLVHRALKVVRSKCCALARCAPIDIGPLLAAYLQLHSPSYAAQGVDAGRVATFRKRFEEMPKPSISPRVNRLASEVISTIGNRASSLGTASCSWGTRAALFAGGDPFVGVEAVAWANGQEEGAPAGGQDRVRWIGRQAEARDLVVFSVSQEYATLRGRVGIGVELLEDLEGSELEELQEID